MAQPRSDWLGGHPRTKLEADGFLARPEWTEIKAATLLIAPQIPDVDHISEGDIEKIDYALKIRADNPTRRMLVLDRMLNMCEGHTSQVIYSRRSVLDAECMAFLVRQKWHRRRLRQRRYSRRHPPQNHRRFQSGRVKVLCNCEVLTTGFDAPKISHMVMARPTMSQVLYEQMIGRGLRGPRFGGTGKCVIVDLEYKYRSERPKLGYLQFYRRPTNHREGGNREGHTRAIVRPLT